MKTVKEIAKKPSFWIVLTMISALLGAPPAVTQAVLAAIQAVNTTLHQEQPAPLKANPNFPIATEKKD